jgi:hypothetical protein
MDSSQADQVPKLFLTLCERERGKDRGKEGRKGGKGKEVSAYLVLR